MPSAPPARRHHQPHHGRRRPRRSGPIACLKRVKPEAAACNAGSLNYLKIKEDGTWAWPPMVFDNPVAKIEEMLAAMRETGTHPEFECFDVGIVRSVGMYLKAPHVRRRARSELRHGGGERHARRRRPAGAVAALCTAGRGVAGDADRPRRDLARAPARRRLGGMLRTGLEDTFYLPGGERARATASSSRRWPAARACGREVASRRSARGSG
ncbi:MAG: 3-keto-5-aminohexanoate cleavage protein [Rubrivivax sp.]